MKMNRDKSYESEIKKQVTTGIVTNPKPLGRFKYKQRKNDY